MKLKEYLNKNNISSIDHKQEKCLILVIEEIIKNNYNFSFSDLDKMLYDMSVTEESWIWIFDSAKKYEKMYAFI